MTKQPRRLAPTQQTDVPADWKPRIRNRAQLDEVVFLPKIGASYRIREVSPFQSVIEEAPL